MWNDIEERWIQIQDIHIGQKDLNKKLAEYENTGLEPEEMYKAKPLEKWHEEDGDCLWWSFPIEEPPYCGTPLDCDFPDHVTHFTRFIIPQN